jgi:hypothetical protein
MPKIAIFLANLITKITYIPFICKLFPFYSQRIINLAFQKILKFWKKILQFFFIIYIIDLTKDKS